MSSSSAQPPAETEVRFVVLHEQLLLAQVLGARLAKIAGFRCLAATDNAATALMQRGVDVLLVDERLIDRGLAWPATHGEMDRPALALLGDDAGGDPAELAEAALRAGARAWIPADTELSELTAALRNVADGQVWVPQSQAFAVIERLTRSQAQPAPPHLLPLTERETEVLTRLAAGNSTAEIANALYVTVNTVRTHRRQIFLKLGVHSAREAAAIARSAGLSPATQRFSVQ